MNSVERVKLICKERKIPISRLEKDLGYANGYISQLRKGNFPANRLSEIAEYLSVSLDFLLTGEQKEKPSAQNGEELGESKQKLLNMIDDMSDEEMALLFERIKKIKESRI